MTQQILRRDVLKLAAAASMTTALGGTRTRAADQAASAPAAARKLAWGNLLHLGSNFWCDWVPPQLQDEDSNYSPDLRFDRSLWNDLLPRMQQAGMNMVVIDLGDGVKYDSHPEIAVKGAWTTAELRKELVRLRSMGLEPIPKLNFSTTHDVWLAKYARCVSTDTYYAVCRDLIAEVIQLFDKPRLFHIGMDEEDQAHQTYYEHVVVRQHGLWWHDLLFYVEQVEKGGARAWMWSDYSWNHPEEFYKRMPKSILQSNWYYDLKFDPKDKMVRPFRELDEHGYDQFPTGSNYYTHHSNFVALAEYARRTVAPEHLVGLLQTPWHPTTEKYRAQHLDAIDQVAKAIAAAGAH
jgi:hypothetical protein